MPVAAWFPLVCAGFLYAAQPSQAGSCEPPLVRVDVDLVQFDAIVTDARGVHVADLKPDDFEILDGGQPQRITNFSYISKARTTTTPSAQPPQVPGVSAASLRPDQVTRTIAVVVDDLGMNEQSFIYVRQALTEFVEKQVLPGDLIAIVTTTGKLGAMERVTADRKALRAAVARLRSTSLHRQSVLDPDYESPCFSNDVREDYYARLSVAAFRRVVDKLRELPGHKSILLFSEGLPVGMLPMPSKGHACIKKNLLYPDDDLKREYNAFLIHANRCGVTVNTIDPRGLIATFDTAEREQPGKDDKKASVEELYHGLIGSQQNLADIAHKTGGLAITNDNDLPAAMARVLNAENGYYLIAYKPSTPPPSAGDGAPRVRNLAVRVMRSGLKVRFHSSLYADEPKPPSDPAQRLAAAAMSPFAQTGIRVRCASHFWDAGGKTGAVLDTTLFIDARDLTFTTSSDGRHTTTFDMLAVIFGAEIKPLDTFEKSYTVSLTGAAYEKALNDGLVQRLELPLKRAGGYQLRSAVRDHQSERIGSVSEFIEVPDLKRGALALSGIVLQHVDAPGPAAWFHHGEMVAYSYQVLNAHALATSVEVRAELLREGTLLGASAPVAVNTPVDPRGQPDPKRLVVSDQLRLGRQLAPGVYTLRVTATDRRAPGHSVSQSVDLEVIE